MADEDPINSSDQEFPDIPIDPAILNAGQASLERMRENAIAHRMDSKVALRKVDKAPVILNPVIARRNARWANRFDGFFTEVLGKRQYFGYRPALCHWLLAYYLRLLTPEVYSPGQVPAPDDVLRFFLELPTILGPNKMRTEDAYSYSIFVDGATAVIDSIFYRHSASREVFRNGNFDAKLKSVFSTHLARGALTKDPARQREWVDSHLLAEMCRALLLDAADRGTKSWDYRIQQALLLAMLCGTVGRVGDVLGSYDTKDQLLTWGDITLKLFTVVNDGGTQQEEVFRANIKLRFTKGKKDKGGVNGDHRFSPLQPKYASACVIRLLLTHALRMGAILGTPRSFDEVLDNVRRAPGRALRWKTPNSPVFLGHKGTNTDYQLIPGKPASARIGSTSLREAADLVGLPVHLRAHDIRRGGARDVAKLPQEELPGMNLDAARRVLGHSHKATAAGVTESYIGSNTLDHYGPRIHNHDILKRHEGFGLEDSLVEPYVRPLRFKPAQIEQVCEEKGWSVRDKESRKRAGKILRKDDRALWRSGRTTNDDIDEDDSDNDSSEPAAPAKRLRSAAVGGTDPFVLQRPFTAQHAHGSGTPIPELPSHTTHGQALHLPAGGNDTTTDMTLPTPYPSTHISSDGTSQPFFTYPPPPEDEYDDDEDMVDNPADCLEPEYYPGLDDDDDDEDEADLETIQAAIASSAEADALIDRLLLDGVQGGGSGSTTTTTTTSGTPNVSTTAERAHFFVTSGDTVADETLRSHISSSLVGGFVDCLSRVNVVFYRNRQPSIINPITPLTESKTQTEYEALIGYPTTKDIPTFALVKCPNSAKGCAKIFYNFWNATKHADSACALAEQEHLKVKCPVGGCNAVVKDLKLHISLQHTMKEKLRDQGYKVYCRLPDCDGGPYERPSAVVQHLDRIHGLSRAEARTMEAEWSAAGPSAQAAEGGEDQPRLNGVEAGPTALVTGYPMLCPLQCTSTHVYKSRKALSDHFFKVHRTAGKLKDQGSVLKPKDFEDIPHAPVIPKPKTANRRPDYNVRCLIPGCKRSKGALFPNPTSTIKHLKDRHNMTWEQAKAREKEWAGTQAGKTMSHEQAPQGV